MNFSKINRLKMHQKGTTLIFVIVLMPALILIFISLTSGSGVEQRITGDYSQNSDIRNLNDEGILLTIRDGNQIKRSILNAQNGLPDTPELQSFTHGQASIETEVTTQTITIPNTSSQLLQGYLITVKVESEKNGLRAYTEQQLIEAGIP